MFDLDKWQEIFATITNNPLRSFLTSFSVGWGIFMLILLLGLARGLENGLREQFEGDAVNSIWMWGGSTSLLHDGLQPNRRIRFTNEDYEAIRSRLSKDSHITGRFYIPGVVEISYENEIGDYNIRCVHPGHKELENSGIATGRFINQADLDQHRKVAIIGKKVQEDFLNGRPAIGEFLQVNGIPFKIVGVYHEHGDDNEEDAIYLPITTAQRTFNGSRFMNQIMFTVGDATTEESKKIENQIKQLMAERHHFAPEDERALRIRNNKEQFEMFMNIMAGMQVFVAIIALGTLMAGIIGVSNIMLIVVKERTKEIGVRKALGATPASIVGLIIQESIFMTTLAGYIGMLLALPLLAALGNVLPNAMEIYGTPEVSLTIAFSALGILVFFGTLAGLIPAMQAASIRPIEALRDE